MGFPEGPLMSRTFTPSSIRKVSLCHPVLCSAGDKTAISFMCFPKRAVRQSAIIYYSNIWKGFIQKNEWWKCHSRCYISYKMMFWCKTGNSNFINVSFYQTYEMVIEIKLPVMWPILMHWDFMTWRHASAVTFVSWWKYMQNELCQVASQNLSLSTLEVCFL